MNRKDNTVKQLQAECKKRGIGFMTTWTKLALTKRLEDEDKKDKEIDILKSKSKKDQQLVKKAQKDLKKLDKSEIEKKIKSDMIIMQERKIISMREKLDMMKREQNTLIEKSNEIARESVELAKEIKSLEFSAASLK